MAVPFAGGSVQPVHARKGVYGSKYVQLLIHGDQLPPTTNICIRLRQVQAWAKLILGMREHTSSVKPYLFRPSWRQTRR